MGGGGVGAVKGWGTRQKNKGQAKGPATVLDSEIDWSDSQVLQVQCRSPPSLDNNQWAPKTVLPAWDMDNNEARRQNMRQGGGAGSGASSADAFTMGTGAHAKEAAVN